MCVLLRSCVLQFHVVTYMDNTIPGVNPATQRSGRPIKSISQVSPQQPHPTLLKGVVCVKAAVCVFWGGGG